MGVYDVWMASKVTGHRYDLRVKSQSKNSINSVHLACKSFKLEA